MKRLLLLMLLPIQISGFEASSLSLNKQRMVLTTEFKGYSISSSERINLYGAKRRKFINQTTWGKPAMGHYLVSDPATLRAVSSLVN